MKRLHGIVLLLSFAGIAHAIQPYVLLDSAANSYSKANFEKAAMYYKEVISMGYKSPEVYFNLANSYYKSDKLGLAILNYEKARKLAPDDEDINFNLKFVNQKTIDKIEPEPQLFLISWWDSIQSMQSEKAWGIQSIICFSLFLFCLGVFFISAKLFIKQLGFWFGGAFLILSILTFTIAKSAYHDITDKNSVIVLASSVEIKNAPSNAGTKLFILHEGTKAAVSQATTTPNGDWVQISISLDKVGWVKKSSLGFI